MEYKYCFECGHKISTKAEICPQCGTRQIPATTKPQDEKNRWVIVLILCWFAGVLGVHRFYTGHTGIGIAQLLTLGGCGIWTLIDLIIILSGNFKDADGNLIKQS